MEKIKVIVDRDACIACGVAQAVCPDVFVLGEDNGKNRVVDRYSSELDEHISIGYVPSNLLDCVKAAIDSCPVNAIRYEVEK